MHTSGTPHERAAFDGLPTGVGNDKRGTGQNSPVWHICFGFGIRREAKLRCVNSGTGSEEDSGFQSTDSVENARDEGGLIHITGRKAHQNQWVRVLWRPGRAPFATEMFEGRADVVHVCGQRQSAGKVELWCRQDIDAGNGT